MPMMVSPARAGLSVDGVDDPIARRVIKRASHKRVRRMTSRQVAVDVAVCKHTAPFRTRYDAWPTRAQFKAVPWEDRRHVVWTDIYLN